MKSPMTLDRKLQRSILQVLQEVYPDSLLVSSLPEFCHGRKFMGNLFYLQEHGLIIGGDIREPGQCRSMVDAQITKDGLDFLAEDGGLSALLKLLTVRIDSREIKTAIEAGLRGLNLNEKESKELSGKIDDMNNAELKSLLLTLAERCVAEQPGLFFHGLSE